MQVIFLLFKFILIRSSIEFLLDMDFTPKRKRVVKNENNALLETYPHDMQLYKIPPKGQLSLSEFEEFALERQKVLQTVESTAVQPENKSLKDFRNALVTALKRENFLGYAKLVNSSGCPPNPDFEARRKDHVSHFILRLAYCQNETLQGFFLKHETDLFKCRFYSLSESKEGMKQFLANSGFHYQPISREEKEERREVLIDSTAKDITDFDSVNFYKIPFGDVLDLVADRKVYLHKGLAYVPESELLSVFVATYRHHLTTELMKSKEFLLRHLNDVRLQGFLKTLPDCYAGMGKVVWTEKTPLNKLHDLAKVSFPLCMRSLHECLTKDHKLKHAGRLQYGLFLKGIGVSLDDALKFWREEFTKHPDINDDIFDKKYSYGIRHNYGKEGNQKNYTPMGCSKIINGSVGPGENHGCPYKHMDTDELKKKLTECHISPADIAEMVKFSKEGQYHLACRKYFEATHKEPPPRAILHPNAYFNDSRDIHNKDLMEVDTEQETSGPSSIQSRNSPERNNTPQRARGKMDNITNTPTRSVERKPKPIDKKVTTKNDNTIDIEAILFQDDSD